MQILIGFALACAVIAVGLGIGAHYRLDVLQALDKVDREEREKKK